MKIKNFFSYIGLALFMGLAWTSCSQDESIGATGPQETMENGMYVYHVDLDCGFTDFDQVGTRAVSYNWNKGATLFGRFKRGSTYVLGIVSFEADGSYTLRTFTTLSNTSTQSNCELYFFQASNGDYYVANLDTQKYDVYNNGSFVRSTTIALNASSIELAADMAVYSTTEATYTKSSSATNIRGTLKPMMWRLRFKGTNGTSITLPSASNEIKYCSAFSWSASSVSFTKETKDVNLAVSSSYTPYVYGEFSNANASNKITVKNGSNVYIRNFNASNLAAGTSGYFDIPTESNYSSKGWTKDALCEIPCTEWGASKATVKALVANKGFVIDRESDQSIYFKPKHVEIQSDCYFDENGLYWSSVDFSPSVASFSDLESYVREQGATYDHTMDDGTKWFVSADGKSKIAIIKFDSGVLCVIYYRNTSSSNVDSNATIEPDYFVAFTDGMVTNWKLGSTVNTFYYKVLAKSETEALSDDDLANKLFGENAYTMEDADATFRHTHSDFSPNTQYYLCAVAKNSSGTRGPVLRYLFKTNSSSLPYAEVSNVNATATNKWSCSVALKNNAKSYYVCGWTGENAYKSDWHFYAYWARQAIASGTEEAIDWTGITWTLNSGTCDYFTVCTWGVGTDNSIGNPYVAYGSVSSSAPVWKQNAAKSVPQKEAISKKSLERMMKNTQLYRVDF